MMNMMNCFGCWNIDGVTVVKITLSKHTQKGSLKNSFIAEVKGLVGIHLKIKAFIESFRARAQSNGYCNSSKIIMG